MEKAIEGYDSPHKRSKKRDLIYDNKGAVIFFFFFGIYGYFFHPQQQYIQKKTHTTEPKKKRLSTLCTLREQCYSLSNSLIPTLTFSNMSTQERFHIKQMSGE